jgi:hypothetical protein
MRLAWLGLLALGCGYEGEAFAPEPGDSEESYELELDSWAPVRPACHPTREQQRRFEENIAQRAVFPWTSIAGSYSTRGDGLGRELVIFEEGRYEWRSWGCTGVRLETGTVDHHESWVVLEAPECRFGGEPYSAGVFVAGELGGRLVLADPDLIDPDAEPADAPDDETPAPVGEAFVPFPAITGQPAWWYERDSAAQGTSVTVSPE